MTILASYPFRVTRNSDLYIDEDGADDLLDALAGELSSAGLWRCGPTRGWRELPRRDRQTFLRNTLVCKKGMSTV